MGDNLIELAKPHYTIEDIENIRTTMLQYFTLLGHSTEKVENKEVFIEYFLESVDPTSKEKH